MNLNTELNVQEKLAFVNANRGRFNLIENKTISELDVSAVSNKNTPLSFSKLVQLQTFYKCCRPAYESLFWEDEVNYKVPYPVIGIVAFKQNEEKYYAVDVKIATWAQSGGTRLIPIKSSLPKQKIKEIMRYSHSLIVPEYQGDVQSQFFQYLSDFIKENSDYPVMALGNSAIMLLSSLINSPDLRKKARLDLKFHNSQIAAFVSHDDRLFRDIDLKIRLQVENKTRIMSSFTHLPFELFSTYKSQKVELIGVGKGKTDDWGVLVAREGLIHFCFIDPRQSGNNLDHVGFSHKLIVSFMEQIRNKEKIIQQKGIELGQYKVTIKNDRYFYNIDSKLQKI